MTGNPSDKVIPDNMTNLRNRIKFRIKKPSTASARQRNVAGESSIVEAGVDATIEPRVVSEPCTPKGDEIVLKEGEILAVRRGRSQAARAQGKGKGKAI